ncbi:MAG: RIP metalloprotease RseP [Rhodothermales bacterium]
MGPVMTILWAILSVVGAIMILVFVHEMGHFLFAKLFKMRVDRFSVGFPPKIVGKKIGETEYVIGATPLGGYVKIAGMVDESMDTEFSESEPQPWEFRAKPVWQRIIVITAGVVFNILLAAVIYMGLKYAYGDAQAIATDDGSVYVADSSLAYTIGLRTGDRILKIGGKPFDPYAGAKNLNALLADDLTIEVGRDGEQLQFEGPEDIITQLSRAGTLGISAEASVVGDVLEGSPAQEAGLQHGDRIIAIGGEPVKFWAQLTGRIQASEGEPLHVQWVREGEHAVYDAHIAPKRENEDEAYLIGVGQGIRYKEYTLAQAVVSGIETTWVSTIGTAISLKRIFTGRENIRENIGGPLMVAKIAGQAAQRGAYDFWNIVALLSITLAIVNILPIPALDGGHLMFLLYEGITRREPSLKVRMVMQQVGMVLLLALMVLLVFNDILRL